MLNIPKLRLSVTLDDRQNLINNAYDHFISSKHFHSLDGLRCLSILAVIWHHAAGDKYPTNSIWQAGHHGVTLFFVISGFLITTLLMREKKTVGDISLRQFYVRRTLRIFPLYYAVILLYVIVVYLVEGQSSYGVAFFNNLIYFFTYTSNYFVALNGDRVIFYFAWSLAAEEQFYMLWPTIEKWLNEQASILVALCLILMALVTKNVDLLILHDSLIYLLIDNVAIPICIGVLLAHAMNHRTTFTLMYALISHRFSAPLFAMLIYITLTQSMIPLLLTYIVMALLIASSVVTKQSIFYAVLNSRLAIEVGKVSYGMYLFHMLALNALRRVLPISDDFSLLFEAILFFTTCVLTFAIAKISFHYFERYFMNLKKHFHVRRPDAPQIS